MKDRVLRDFKPEDICRIADTFHAWRKGQGYADVPGFCKAAALDQIEQRDHMLTPGRYVDAAALVDDGEPFETKMKLLADTLARQVTEAGKLDAAIAANLEELGYGR